MKHGIDVDIGKEYEGTPELIGPNIGPICAFSNAYISGCGANALRSGAA
jgi:hypothetical protein